MKHLAHYVCVSLTVIGFVFIAVRLLLRFSANIRNAIVREDSFETEKVLPNRRTVRVSYYVAPSGGIFSRSVTRFVSGSRRLDFQFWAKVLLLIMWILLFCFVRK